MSSDAAAATVHKGGLQQTTMFIASSVWAGSKEGMVFKEGAQGLGYYNDSVEGVHPGYSESPGSLLEAIEVAGHVVPTVGSEEERILLDMEEVASRGGKTFQVYLEVGGEGMGLDVDEGGGCSFINSLIPGGVAEAVRHPLMGQLQQGDIIRYINGRPVGVEGLGSTIVSGESTLQLTIQRVGQPATPAAAAEPLPMTPETADVPQIEVAQLPEIAAGVRPDVTSQQVTPHHTVMHATTHL